MHLPESVENAGKMDNSCALDMIDNSVHALRLTMILWKGEYSCNASARGTHGVGGVALCRATEIVT